MSKLTFKSNHIIIPLITIIVAVLGSRITGAGMEWYKHLTLPSWTPSGAVIGAVWTIIFILAAISALLVWNKTVHVGLFWLVVALFIINALLNVSWSLLFFGMHQMYAAIWEAGLLGLSVVVLIILIWKANKLASVLLVPYAGWVVFAAFLTYKVWFLNK